MKERIVDGVRWSPKKDKVSGPVECAHTDEGMPDGLQLGVRSAPRMP